jgi:hypothetical protein
MGFKINKGRSWKKLGEKTSKKTFSKKNMSSIDQSWDNTTKNLREDTRKTVKSAGKGIKRAADDIAGNMTIWIVAGVVVLGGGYLLTNDTGVVVNN